ncbi:MAG: ATP-binding cassette domain-containing protein [Lachnospiraceae bacterium]|nr:ATP-binding cassette domain-containing protein [Lachnospiraceae bacterium]
MLKLLKKINFILDKQQKKQFVLLGVLVFVGGFLETLGVTALIPAITVVLNPELLMSFIADSEFLSGIYNFLGIESFSQLAAGLLIGIVAVFVVKNLFALFLASRQASFIYMGKIVTVSRVLRGFLNRPYEAYLGTNIPAFMRLIDSDIPKSYALIMAVLQLTSEIVVAVLLFILLVVSDWQFTLFVMFLFGSVTLFFYKVLRPVINRLGQKCHVIEADVAKWRLQIAYGLKDIKVLNREGFFLKSYVRDGSVGAETTRKYIVLNNTPRLLVETVFIAGVLAFVMINMLNSHSSDELAMTMAVFGAAAIRMLPSFTRMNTYFSDIAFNQASFEYLCERLGEEGEEGGRPRTVAPTEDVQVLVGAVGNRPHKHVLQHEILLDNITYAYPGTDCNIFDAATMRVPFGQSVGIIGPSGAGKSTVVDIMLGLLRPQAGTVTCDGRDIFANHESWLAQIGYIPQAIYLVDESIRVNVAFGIDRENIDDERVWAVLAEAQMKEFVMGLPEGLNTAIGDRGIRLSGGQRQRIGIARALYHQPEILVFDEATSALDDGTEQEVLEAINHFYGKKTMVIIAHRLNTIAKCDMVYQVVEGKLKETKVG